MNRETIGFGASLLKELGLWAGVIVSIVMGILWCLPLLIQYFFGSPHTSDTLENFLIVSAGVAMVCLLAAVFFVIGAIRNTVGGKDAMPIIEYDGGDTERM